MAVVFSVLTPDWLLHVSDAPGGTPRTLELQRAKAPGLLTWAGEPDTLASALPAIRERNAKDPADLAEALATEVAARSTVGDPGTALLAGWGVSPEGHKASWRWRVTNFEDEDSDGVFAVDGTWLVPSYAQPGGKGKGKARTSFSVQVSTTGELSDEIRRGIDKLPRDIRKKVAPTQIALQLAGWVREVEGAETPVLLALLRPDGSLEGGRLDGGALTPVHASGEDGIHPLRVG